MSTKLRLSEAFIHEDKSGDFEWTATVYNLNRGKNDELLRRCKPLADYMELINRICDNQKSGLPAREAIDKAVDSCIKDGIMEDFLVKHKAEVLSVCITEFDEKVYTDGIREEGREEGRNSQIIESVKSLIEKLDINEEEACRLLGIDVEQYYKTKAEIRKQSNNI